MEVDGLQWVLVLPAAFKAAVQVYSIFYGHFAAIEVATW